MRLSTLFTKTRKEAPKDEQARNAQLLIRAGFIHKEMAGVYAYLPLGLIVLNRIAAIIREEMEAIGGQEVFLTTLQNPEIWQKSGRWVEEDVDPTKGLPWLKTALASGAELGIGNTHEEALAGAVRLHVESYKDLPCYIFQIQNKFRNEIRAKSGLMRAREFLMKDLYSFTRDEAQLEEYYERVAEAYIRIFERVGIGDKTLRTYASGGAFSRFSDEFQMLCDAGEDTIYVDEKKRVAINKEIYSADLVKELQLDGDNLKEAKAIEVGNIFKLGTRYSEAVGLNYIDEQGQSHPVVMGSYGIGLGRLMGAVVEANNDEKGIIWPNSIAPAHYHIVRIGDNKAVVEAADKLYERLSKDAAVIYDDREISPGAKFADADLLGAPIRLTVSPKTLEKKGVEYKERRQDSVKIIPLDSDFD